MSSTLFTLRPNGQTIDSPPDSRCRRRANRATSHRLAHRKGEAVKRYGSDVMVDAIKACGFTYVSLNPGSSYRGLHDSLVNYGGNDPEMITCNHEKLAVGIAHGYAKAAREPMAVHPPRHRRPAAGDDGHLLRLDRPRAGRRLRRRRPDGLRPPAAEHRLDPHGERPGQRRPRLHEVGRPAGVGRARSPESIMRGYRIATAAPQGPVYIALDAGLQEDEVGDDVRAARLVDRLKTPSRIGPDPAALRELADAPVRRGAAAHRRRATPAATANAFGQLVASSRSCSAPASSTPAGGSTSRTATRTR